MTSDQTWGCPSEINNAGSWSVPSFSSGFSPTINNAGSWSWSLPSSSSGFCSTINNAGSCSLPSFSSGFSPTINNTGSCSWSWSLPSSSSGFCPTTPINSDGSSSCGFLGTPVTVAPPQSFSSGFHSTSHNQKHTIPRKYVKARKKASKLSSLRINTYDEDESVSMNALMSKSPVKEEKSADSQHENRVPAEMKHKTVKRETIKNSPLPMILTSRILKGIPQNPHFLELRRYSATSRTHLEAAWDRAFEETVEQIHGLRASGFWVGARKIWKTMEELERLGYNVFVLRKRVVELTDLMVKQNKRQNEIMVLKVRAELHRMEKSRLESVIRNLRVEAQSEQNKMVENLIEAADKEKDLPQLENELANLAIEPLEV